MKKNIILIICVLLIIISFGVIYFFKIYNSDKNVMERYLESNGYTCVGNTCTKKNKDSKYNYDIKTNDLYVSKDKYVLVIGDNYPVIKFKSSSRVCNYEIDNYRVGDHVNSKFSYDKECEEYINDINVYIDEYKNIVKNSK